MASYPFCKERVFLPSRRLGITVWFHEYCKVREPFCKISVATAEVATANASVGERVSDSDSEVFF